MNRCLFVPDLFCYVKCDIELADAHEFLLKSGDYRDNWKTVVREIYVYLCGNPGWEFGSY
jgi:hypothetical protein